MSEPKIINRVGPLPYYSGHLPLYGSSALQDDNPLSVATSVGKAGEGVFVEGYIGDGVTNNDYTMVLFTNTNKAFFDPQFGFGSYNLRVDSTFVSGIKGIQYVDVNGYRNVGFSFNKITGTKFGFAWSQTDPPNQEKTIGDVFLGNENTVALTRDFSSYQEKWREKVKEIMLGDGGVHRVITLSDSGKNLRYEAHCQFRFLSEIELYQIKKLKDSGADFFFQPESETNPHKIYKCVISGPFNVNYSTSYKGAGYTLNMVVKGIE